MNITRAALDKTRITYVALAVVALAGLFFFKSLPRDEDPGFVVRTAQVLTYFPGASPERVEQLVTDKLEKIIQEIPEIDYIDSESKPGVSVIFVNILERYKNMRPIWDNLRRKVARATGELPEEVVGPFVNDEFGDIFGTLIAITGKDFSYAELKTIADDCRNELLLSEDIAKVDIQGVQQERIFVEYNNARLAELGLSPLQLKSILEARNIIIPGGEIFTDKEQIVLEPTGNFDSVEDLKRTVINVPGGQDVVFLEDLVAIHRGYIDPPKAKVHYAGQPALTLAIHLREGGDILKLGEEVQQALVRFQQAYPIGVNFDLVAFQPKHVERKVNEFVNNLLQAMLIVLVMMLVFLGLRTGLVVAGLIPMAMIMSLMVMGFLNIGIDQMSLASLIIALGMLVDNAIVMSESIMVQMAEGKPARQAAIDSAQELKIPLLTSSLTTAVAFLPIFLAKSSTGEYTAPLFKVVTITLLCSWLLSLTMTPLLCTHFLHPESKAGSVNFQSRFYRSYRRVLLGLLRHPWMSIAAIVVVFIAAMAAMQLVPKSFFPANEKAIFYAELRLPMGTPLKRTEAVVQQIEDFMRTELVRKADGEGITDWVAFIGEGAPRFMLPYKPEPPSPEYAYVLINGTSRRHNLEVSLPRLEAFCQSHFPDLTPRIRPLNLGPPIDNPVEIRLSGKDSDKLFAIADEVKKHLAGMSGIVNIGDDWGARTKKLVVRVNQPRALRAGLTSRDVAVSLQTILSGITTTEYREQDEVIPVTLRSTAADRQDFGKLETHNIYVQRTGQSVPLKQVADIEIAWQPAKILRRDRRRTVTVEAGMDQTGNPIAIARKMDSWLQKAQQKWPFGYKYEMGGELETSGKANESIAVNLPLTGLIVVLLLVGQFNSLRRPLIILLTIPLGMIGVTVGLLLTGSYFGFMTLLGVISLAGIVINNAIVLIDRIQIEIEQNGLPPAEAILESGMRRLRPILLTTGTTVGGLLPLWLGGGPLWETMAIAIIFGLLFATVLTLGVVPLLYSLFFRVSFKDVQG
ncbi:efflux pump, RND family, inner membrane protein [Syntrophotalea carbinolica DSM 2380]|uniref:Efflux pump, RND family, inner membrane protein n=1 Tax=Syntrophotalea carbinolica (strain DSM 2380 / NBRC 103641 / GraBd1) TaxID=338963 RepID=Q3A071_SYNC1|nr:efflux RND transporter permease subunit [Syntrophotalea carbinolica]ABA90236.1 efflux pump, RND family, inner membrane protein [Syntrophotalea carbinolica DSM 2380]